MWRVLEASYARRGSGKKGDLGRLSRARKVLCGSLKDVLMINKKILREGGEVGRWGDISKGVQREYVATSDLHERWVTLKLKCLPAVCP